jgi:hypothetical protein
LNGERNGEKGLTARCVGALDRLQKESSGASDRLSSGASRRLQAAWCTRPPPYIKSDVLGFIFINNQTFIVHGLVVHRTDLQRLLRVDVCWPTTSWHPVRRLTRPVWSPSAMERLQSDPGLRAKGPSPMAHGTSRVPTQQANFQQVFE